MTAPDPWASAPAAPTEDPWASGPPPVAAETSVGQAPDGKFVVTLKGGSGFDAPWFVAHLNSLAEIEAALSDPALKRILDKLQTIAPIFSAASQSVGGASSAPRRPAPQAAVEAPAGAPAAPGPDWTYRSGVVKSGAKAGQVWQGWMPPRGSDAKPLFFD